MPAADDHEGHRRHPTAEMSALTDDQLVKAIQQSEQVRRASRERTGRLLAELHQRGRLSWRAIARSTGISLTTAYELAEPYIAADEGPERPAP